MSYTPFPSFFFFFFFNDTATTEIYTLSLHDALPISAELVDHRRIERQARRDDQRATLGDGEGQQAMLLEILGREPLGQRARGGGAQVGGRAGRLRLWRGRGGLGAQPPVGHGFRGGGGR